MLYDLDEGRIADVDKHICWTPVRRQDPAYPECLRSGPRYLPSMTAAEPQGGDRVRVEANVDGRTESGEAWMRVDREQGRIEWGSEGPNDYHGNLQISDDGPGRCTIELDLHTVRAEGTEIEEGARHAVDGLIKAINAKTDAGEH